MAVHLVPQMSPAQLCFMAGLCVAAGMVRPAEGYLLELLAWVAFGRDEEEDYP